MSAPKRFVVAMKTHGLTGSAAIRGLRLLKIEPMATPELLSRPCGICVVRKRVEARRPGYSALAIELNPSTWIYRPFINDNHPITACDFHTAQAVRVALSTGLTT